jgi:hypothetical protein
MSSPQGSKSQYAPGPLPSPTTNAPQHFYFPPVSSRQVQAQSIPSMQQQLPVSQTSSQPQSIQSNNHAIAQSNDPSSQLRRDFNLLAEAAKKAQLAVITRDLGDVAL